MVEIRARQKDTVIILDLKGAVDVNAGNLVEMVSRCLHDGYTDILCNLHEVTSLDYMGISVLVIAYKQAVNNRGRMKLVGIPPHLWKALTVAGIDKAIELYAGEDEALSSFRTDRAIDAIQRMQLRRRFKRLPMGVKGRICPAGDPAGEAKEKVTVMNLSGVGAYVFGFRKAGLGDDVVLCLRLSPRQEEVRIEAKVVWLPDKQVQHRMYPGMGIEFRNIDPAVQQELLGFIERNLSSMTSDLE